MARASATDDATGRVSLPVALFVAALVVLVAAAVALVPVGPLHLGDLTVAGPGGESAEAVEEVDGDAGLQVALRGPRHLVPGYASPLEVRVTERGGGPLALDARRLQLTFDLDLVPEARGWVVVTPARLLVAPAELASQRIALLGFGGVPCTEELDELGILTVTARELVQDGRTATAELIVPGAACELDVPEAPETVNQLEAPSRSPSSGWRPAPTSDGDAAEDEDDEADVEEDDEPEEGDRDAERAEDDEAEDDETPEVPREATTPHRDQDDEQDEGAPPEEHPADADPDPGDGNGGDEGSGDASDDGDAGNAGADDD